MGVGATVTDIWEDRVRDMPEGHRPAGHVGWTSSSYAAKRGTNRQKHVQPWEKRRLFEWSQVSPGSWQETEARAVGSFEMSLVKGLFAQVLTDARKSRGSNYQLLETDREDHQAMAVTFGHVSHDDFLGWRLL